MKTLLAVVLLATGAAADQIISPGQFAAGHDLVISPQVPQPPPLALRRVSLSHGARGGSLGRVTSGDTWTYEDWHVEFAGGTAERTIELIDGLGTAQYTSTFTVDPWSFQLPYHEATITQPELGVFRAMPLIEFAEIVASPFTGSWMIDGPTETVASDFSVPFTSLVPFSRSHRFSDVGFEYGSLKPGHLGLEISARELFDGVVDGVRFQVSLQSGAGIAGYVGRGDVNADGGPPNFQDLSPMVTALTDPEMWSGQFPYLDRVGQCDVNRGGSCNFGDLTPFAELLTRDGASGSAVPEPSALLLFVAGAVGLGVLRRRR